MNNPGNTGVQINSLTTTGDFAISYFYCGSLPYVLASGSACNVEVTFTPTQTSGAESGTVVVGTSAGNFTVNLSGTAQAATQAIGITPTTFNFGTVQKGATAGNDNSSRVYVRNTGTESVTFSGAPTITGTNAADFAVSYNAGCGNQFTSGTPLAPSTSCVFLITFTPSTTGAETATLTLTDSAGTQTMALSGTGAAAQPAVTLDPTTLPFDLQVVGTTSNLSYYVYLANNGSSALTIQSASITAGSSDFSIPSGYDSCSGQSVAASGGQCYVYVNFAPSSAGYRTGTLAFKDQNNNTYTLALAGYAPAAVNSATLDPQALDFLPQSLNASGGNGAQSTQYVTLTNTGNRPLTVGTLTGTDFVIGTVTTGDFTTASSGGGGDYCGGQTVAPNSACEVVLSFFPSTAGSKSGSITFPVTYADNTKASFTATLSGQAVNETDSATLSPTNVSFLDQVAAHPTTSSSATITLTNNSNLALTVGTLTGTDTIVGTSTSGDFVAASTTLFGVGINGYDGCSGQTIPSKSSCTVYVYFAPGTTGAKTGSLTFPVTYTSGTKASFTATLSGNSIAAVNTIGVNPLSAQFQSQVVGTTDTSNIATINVQNTGNIPVTFSSSTLSSANFTFDYDGCGSSTIQPNSSCIIYVYFTPQASATPGTLTGTLTINDSATGNPHKASLSGAALAASQQLAVSQSTVSFGNQPVSTSSNPQVVYVINQGTSAQRALKSVLLGGTNATDFTESDNCGGSSGTTLNARSTCNITVTFAPGASSTGSRTATVTVTPTSGSSLVVTLNGTGTNPIPQATVFPTTINFGSQPVNTTSTSYEYFTVTNREARLSD